MRKFARELGADINTITGSEKFGRVSEDDVKSFVKLGINQKQPLKNNEENQKQKIKIEYDHSDFGEIDLKDIPRIKKLAAPHLVNSFNTIPHVTHHDEIDITEMEELKDGNSFRAATKAFIINANGVIFNFSPV